MLRVLGGQGVHQACLRYGDKLNFLCSSTNTIPRLYLRSLILALSVVPTQVRGLIHSGHLHCRLKINPSKCLASKLDVADSSWKREITPICASTHAERHVKDQSQIEWTVWEKQKFIDTGPPTPHFRLSCSLHMYFWLSFRRYIVGDSERAPAILLTLKSR